MKQRGEHVWRTISSSNRPGEVCNGALARVTGARVLTSSVAESADVQNKISSKSDKDMFEGGEQAG